MGPLLGSERVTPNQEQGFTKLTLICGLVLLIVDRLWFQDGFAFVMGVFMCLAPLSLKDRAS